MKHLANMIIAATFTFASVNVAAAQNLSTAQSLITSGSLAAIPSTPTTGAGTGVVIAFVATTEAGNGLAIISSNDVFGQGQGLVTAVPVTCLADSEQANFAEGASINCVTPAMSVYPDEPTESIIKITGGEVAVRCSYESCVAEFTVSDPIESEKSYVAYDVPHLIVTPDGSVASANSDEITADNPSPKDPTSLVGLPSVPPSFFSARPSERESIYRSSQGLFSSCATAGLLFNGGVQVCVMDTGLCPTTIDLLLAGGKETLWNRMTA